MGGFIPWYDPKEYWSDVGSSIGEGADWLFNSPVLKPISDYLRDDERKKAARALIPGYSGLEAITGGISGAGALLGMGMDNGPMEDIPDWKDILKREAGEGIHAGIETIAPIDLATTGLGGLSSFKGLKGLGSISEALNATEGLYGGGQVVHGGMTGNLPEMGVGALRVAGGGVGLAGGKNLGRALELEPTSYSGNRGELPNFVSAMSPEGRGFIPEEVGIGETLRRPREPFSTLAEHGSPTRSWFDRGESPQVSTGPQTYGEGMYASQITGEGPGYARARSSSMREHPDMFTEEVRGEMVPLKGDPITLKGDVSADKPLFLGDTAPRDLRMQALVELQKARRSGLDPEYADQLKGAILRPEVTGHDLVDIGKELITNNIPMEERGSYTGDPYSEFIKSRDYDLWGSNKRGEPQRELVIPDPRRQFRIGEEYNPLEGNREVLADSSGIPIPEYRPLGESLENPSLRVTEPPPTGPTPINIGDWIEGTAKDLGWKPDPFEGLRSKVVEGGGEGSKPILSPNADTLKYILKSGKLTKFTIKDIIDPIEKAGKVIPPDVRESIPRLLDELEATGWINKKSTGTYTLNSTPTRIGIPPSPMGKELSLGDQLKSTMDMVKEGKTLSDIESIKKDILSKPVGEMRGEESLPVRQTIIPEIYSPVVGHLGAPSIEAGKGRQILKEFANGDILTEVNGRQEILSMENGKVKVTPVDKNIIDIPSQTPIEALGESVPPSPPRTPKPPSKPPTTPPKRPEGYKEKPTKSFLDDLTDLPKTLKSAIDISFPMRQGLFLLNRPEGIKAMGKGLKSGKESFHLETRKNLESRPNKELYKKSGLNQIEYDPTTPTSESEQFPSKLAEKIPGVKQSQRIYNDQSNLMRADLFDKGVKDWSAKGMTPDSHPKLYSGYAKYLNVLTGRDPLPTKLAQAGHLLNKAFWSPQFVKSRLQILNPKFYYDLPTEVKKMAVRDVGGTIGVLSTALTAVSMAAKAQGEKDISVESDPRHTDFGKLRVGKQSYDFFSGLLPIVRTGSRILTGTMKTRKGEYNLPGGPGIGRDKNLKDAPFGRTTGSEVSGFVEGKTSPIYQIGKGLLTGEGFAGEKYGGPQFLEDLGGPMGIFDVLEAGGFDPETMGDIGSEFKSLDPVGMSKGLPSLLGVGVQTDFERKKKESKSKKFYLGF